MNATIGRTELLALVKSIEEHGPGKLTNIKDAFEYRPFANGNHWRFKQSFLDGLTDVELAELYSSTSETFKVKKECEHLFDAVRVSHRPDEYSYVCSKCGLSPNPMKP